MLSKYSYIGRSSCNRVVIAVTGKFARTILKPSRDGTWLTVSNNHIAADPSWYIRCMYKYRFNELYMLFVFCLSYHKYIYIHIHTNMVYLLHVPHALFGLFSLWLCISHSCFFQADFEWQCLESQGEGSAQQKDLGKTNPLKYGQFWYLKYWFWFM